MDATRAAIRCWQPRRCRPSRPSTPSTSSPPCASCSRRNGARSSPPKASHAPISIGCAARAHQHRDRPRVGAGLAPELRRLEPAAARGVQSLPAAARPSSRRSSARTRRCTAHFTHRRSATTRRRRSSSAASSRTRCATSGSAASRSTATAAAVPGGHAAARRSRREVRAERHGRDRRVRAPRDRSRPRSRGCPSSFSSARRRSRRSAASKAGCCGSIRRPTKPSWPHAESRALREKYLPSVGHARLRPRAARGPLGQQRADRGDPRAAPRGRAARRLQDLRRVLAGDEDGRVARARHRVPARPREAQPHASRARSSRARALRRPQARGLGRRVLRRAPAARRSSSSPRKSCGRTSRCRACSTACSSSPAPVRRYDLRVTGATPDVWHDSVRYYELKRADGTLIGSFFTDLFARAEQARRRLDGRLRRAARS